MAVDILEVFRLSVVNVARQIQAKVVLGITDLRKRDHARVLWNFSLFIESINDLVNILLPQAVFVAILQEAVARVNNENTFAGSGIFLVEHNDAGLDTCSIKQVRRKPNDSLDVSPADDLPSDVSFDIATEENAVRHDDCSLTCTLERRE